MATGRNDPCPCGSGRKYKKCHYAADVDAARTNDAPAAKHELDGAVAANILDFLEHRYPLEAAELWEDLHSHPQMNPQFGVPWMAYIAEFGGRTAADLFLEKRARSLPPEAVQWLELQRHSWLSVWEIEDFERGSSLTLRDRLTGESRTVREVQGSQHAELHLNLLARVVDSGKESLICGMHPVPLRPTDALEVVNDIRRALRRKTAVPPDRLRSERIALRMLHRWSDAVDRRSSPPTLQNTDGDPFLFVEDRWAVDPSNRRHVLAGLRTIEGAIDEDPEAPSSSVVVFLRSDDTVVGRAEVRAASLHVETNSIARADALRLSLERACGTWISAHRRSMSDPFQAIEGRGVPRASADDEATTAANNAMLRELKERHYAGWLDSPIPALGGRTPRQAIRDRGGKEEVTALLRDIEMRERKLPADERFDVASLFRALGLER